MSEEMFSVRPDALRRSASRLTDAAYRLAHGVAGVSGLVVPAPQWAAGAALAGCEAAVHAWFGELGARVAATGEAVRSAAEAYDAVDDRAAARLTGAPR
ncbi:type VII secretion target [Micromonospora thermarum]|uniref:Excreted virulence factor EspC, type VII ESX diderm n=1 Tax=Micromonospora thermarum TaxID=2720024 RepID=A0ABX0Z7F3_9ACTN|nr:type VII secretion target [Micromonospora thermarum]NJP33189.1 hypothetical protein [Micromonospora thermarum]